MSDAAGRVAGQRNCVVKVYLGAGCKPNVPALPPQYRCHACTMSKGAATTSAPRAARATSRDRRPSRRTKRHVNSNHRPPRHAAQARARVRPAPRAEQLGQRRARLQAPRRRQRGVRGHERQAAQRVPRQPPEPRNGQRDFPRRPRAGDVGAGPRASDARERRYATDGRLGHEGRQRRPVRGSPVTACGTLPEVRRQPVEVLKVDVAVVVEVALAPRRRR